MLRFLGDKVSDRKLRLFAVVCCRRIWHLLSDKRSRSALENAEVLAEKQTTTPSEWQPLRLEAWSAEYELHGGTDLQADHAATVVKDVVSYRRTSEELKILAGSTSWTTAHILDGFHVPSFKTENIAQTVFIRCIFGNPFRMGIIAPGILTWHDSTIPRLAQAIYEERQMPAGTFDPARMNILADALLDAACDNEDIITHCRSDKPHVRGCWALDWILGKS